MFSDTTFRKTVSKVVSEKKLLNQRFRHILYFLTPFFFESGVRYKCNNINSLNDFDTTFSIFRKKLFILKCEKKI